MIVSLNAEQRLVEGNAASRVRVVAYEDLQCSDCAAFRKMMDEHLLPRYGGKVAFEHRDFPLPKHDWARKAAIAARYFESVRPELGVKFRQQTMAKIKEIAASAFDAHVSEFAKANGADPAKALAGLADPKLGALVNEDYLEGIARGVGKTPTVFVNDDPFIETFTLEEISRSIEAALKEGAR